MKRKLTKSPNFTKTIAFFAVTFMLIAVSTFCIAGTVFSQSEIKTNELENYYRTVEKDLLAQTRSHLNELGYQNSGVTLTRVVDEAGYREYTFTIHHSKIDRMSEENRAELAAQLAYETKEKMQLIENASLYHEFLMYD